MHYVVDILTAPLFLHFGDYAIVTDIAIVLADMIDSDAMFFIFFLLIIREAFLRNLAFQTYMKKIYGDFRTILNRVTLLVYIFSFFKALKKGTTSLIKRFFHK